MSSSMTSFSTTNLFSLILVILLSSSQLYVYCSSCHYSSIYSFGDSLTDTGNLLHIDLSSSNSPPHFGRPPYGRSFFHQPTGRCSDGRLVIDFIAEYLGIPYVQPFVGNTNYSEGANFAVVGATALSSDFFEQRGIHDAFSNGSLDLQLSWFRSMLPSLSDHRKVLKDSLIVMGEIGGNDYNHPLLAGRSLEEVQSFMTPVIDKIGESITELIHHGAITFLVPGYLPIGCSASYLAQFESPFKSDYDPVTGCLTWLNRFAQKHNFRLQIELNRIQQLHPHTKIVYADFYNAAMPFYRSPSEYGFTTSTIVACCGGGGKYNYNPALLCGEPGASDSCDNPSQYANWDGLHLTDAGNRIVTRGLFEGPNTIPHFNSLCASRLVSSS
jgi:phospholipase/lecithinase/hemolysin